METNSPELHEVITVIRREHRRTQLIFGVSLIILSVIMMLLVPGIIRMEAASFGQGSNSNGVPQAMEFTNAYGSSTAPAASSTGTSSMRAH